MEQIKLGGILLIVGGILASLFFVLSDVNRGSVGVRAEERCSNYSAVNGNLDSCPLDVCKVQNAGPVTPETRYPEDYFCLDKNQPDMLGGVSSGGGGGSSDNNSTREDGDACVSAGMPGTWNKAKCMCEICAGGGCPGGICTYPSNPESGGGESLGTNPSLGGFRAPDCAPGWTLRSRSIVDNNPAYGISCPAGSISSFSSRTGRVIASTCVNSSSNSREEKTSYNCEIKTEYPIVN